MGLGERGPETKGNSWPSFLRGASAEEVLAKIEGSDPLRLHEGAALRLREVWILLDPDRVFARAKAVVAQCAVTEEPPGDLATWARAKIDVAIERLVRLDLEAERAHPERSTDEERAFPLLTESMYLEPELVRSASVEFNALPPLARRAFFELIIEGRDLGECIEGGPWDEDALYEAIQCALAPFGLDARAQADEAVQERVPRAKKERG